MESEEEYRKRIAKNEQDIFITSGVFVGFTEEQCYWL